jgi:hypothetical protein
MTAYSDIRGYRVKYLASDPTLNTSTEGQVWYNSTSGTLKSLVQLKAWSASNIPVLLDMTMYGAGTANCWFRYLEDIAPGGGYKNATEEYSGYTWSNGGNLGELNCLW